MELNEYQEKAMSTCTESSENFSYMMLNLVGEVGEVASKVAKAIRKNQLLIGKSKAGDGKEIENHLWIHPEYFKEVSMEEVDAMTIEIQKECGDILWQLAGLCHVFGWTLEDVAKQNLKKLADRFDRGVIVGEGDNR